MRINKIKNGLVIFLLLLISLQTVFAQVCLPQQEMQRINEQISDINKAIEVQNKAQEAIELTHESYRKAEESLRSSLEVVEQQYNAGELTKEQYEVLKKVYENEVAQLRKARQLDLLKYENTGLGQEIGQQVEALETNRRARFKQIEDQLSNLEFKLRSQGLSEAEILQRLNQEKIRLLQEYSKEIGTTREKLQREYNLEQISQYEREINKLKDENNTIKSDTRFKIFFEKVASTLEGYGTNKNTESRRQAREELAERINKYPELANKIDQAEVKYRDIRQRVTELLGRENTNNDVAIKQKMKELFKKIAQNPLDIQSWKDVSLLKKHYQNLKIKNSEGLNNYEKLPELGRQLSEAQERLKILPKNSAEYKAVKKEAERILEEINDIAKEAYLETGDLALNNLFELVMRQWEYSKTSEQNQYTFNVRGKQLRDALLEFSKNLKSGKASAIEFALGGGKTSTVAPVMSEIARLLTGRRTTIELPDGKSIDAYNEIGRALSRLGRKVVIVRNTDNPVEILGKIKDADVVLIEASARGFIDAMARATEVSPTLRDAYRRLNLELVKNRTHIQDEAHDGTDPRNRYTLGGAEGKEIPAPLQNEAKLIGDILVELKYLGKGKINGAILSTTAFFKGIFRSARGALFEGDALKQITNKLAGKLSQEGFAQERLAEKIHDYFKNKENSNYAKEFTPEQQTRLKGLLDQINQFAEALNKKPNSDYQYDRLGRKIGLAKNSIPTFNQQVNNAKLALALEYVGATYFGKATNFKAIRTGGSTISSSWLATQYLLLKNGGNYMGMSGTMGKQLQSLIHALKIKLTGSTEMNDLIFGRKNSQGEYEGGLIREATGTKTLDEALDIAIREILKGKKGMFGESKGKDANGNLVMVVPHEGTTAGEIINRLIEAGVKKTFIEKNGENFILKDSQGNKIRDIDSKEAARLMNGEVKDSQGNKIKDIIMVMGEAATTGTDVKLNKNIPFANFASSGNIADSIMQGVKRAGRLAGTNTAEHPDIHMFISGKEVKTGKLSVKEVTEIWDRNQDTASKNSLYDIVSSIIDFHFEKFFVDKLYQEGLSPELTRIAQELNKALTSKGSSEQNLNTEHGVSAIEQTLKGKIKGNTEFFRKILNGEEIVIEGEYTEKGEPRKISSQDVQKFRDSLEPEFRRKLEDLAKEPSKELKFSEGKESERHPLLEETLDGLIEVLSQTIPREALPEFAPGKLNDIFIVKELTARRQNAEQLISQLEGQIVGQNTEVTSRLGEYRDVSLAEVINGLGNGDVITITEGVMAGTYTIEEDEDKTKWLIDATGNLRQLTTTLDAALKTSETINIKRNQQEILTEEIQQAKEALQTFIEAQTNYNQMLLEREQLLQEKINIEEVEAKNKAAEAMYNLFKSKGLESLLLNQVDILNYLSSIPQEELSDIITASENPELNGPKVKEIISKFSQRIAEGTLLKRQYGEQILTDTSNYKQQVINYATQTKNLNKDLLNAMRSALLGLSRSRENTILGIPTTSIYDQLNKLMEQLDQTDIDSLLQNLDQTEFELTKQQIKTLTELKSMISNNLMNLQIILSTISELLTQDQTTEQREQLSKEYNNAAKLLQQYQQLEEQTRKTTRQINLDIGIEQLSQQEIKELITELEKELKKVLPDGEDILTLESRINSFQETLDSEALKDDEKARKALQDEIDGIKETINKLQKLAQLKTQLAQLEAIEIPTPTEIPTTQEIPAEEKPILEEVPIEEELPAETQRVLASVEKLGEELERTRTIEDSVYRLVQDIADKGVSQACE